MILYKKGDALKDDCQVLAHQVNCLGVMGAGIALQIKNAFPLVFEEYSRLCREKDPTRLLGHCLVVCVSKKKYIANLFGQFGVGKPVDTDYEALKKGFEELKREMIAKALVSVTFPKFIGCGLAGGDWNIVLPTIEERFNGFEVHIVEFNGQSIEKLPIRKKQSV